MDEKTNAQQPQQGTPAAASSSMDTPKLLAILGYVIPLLFFLPLVMDETKNNAFSKFHANQQLNMLLFSVIGWVAGTVLSVIVIGILIIPLVAVASLVFMVLGILSASKGEMKPLPVIGGYTLLK